MSKMKYSGVEWIGDIPYEWEINKLKNIADIYTGNSISDDNKSLYEDSVDAFPYIATKDISLLDATVNYDNGMFTKYRDKKFKIAYSGDTLLCIEGGSAGKKIAKIDCDVSFVNKLCCFHGRTINNTYLYYYLLSDSFRENFNQNIFGLIGGVSQFTLKQFNICIPNIFEQKTIADFLDKKIKELDEVLNDLNKQVEILINYKKSLITEKMTKGLNLNVKCKNSNCEWINQIPSHWYIKPMKYITNLIIDGTHETPTYIDDGVPFLRVTDITSENGIDKKIDLLSAAKISLDESKILNKRCRPEKGDLLVSKNGTIGVPKIIDWDSTFSIFVSLCLIKVNSQEVITKYLYYYFRSSLIDTEIAFGGKTNTITNLHLEKISNFKIPLPPIEEQKEIVEYLDRKCEQIDKIIGDKQKQITKIEEYKKSVIYEYVTGKKRVEGAEELYG